MTAAATQQLIEAAYPLSPLQQGLLFHSVSTAGADIYVRQVRYDLTGPIDTDALAEAWRVAAAAHQPLRTGIFWEGLAAPVQVVARRADLELTVEDVDPRAAGGRYAAVAAVELRDRAAGFDLRRPPLVRATLVRLSDTDHVLVLTFHHIVVDGWSMPLLLGDVFLAYAQLVDGEPATLPPRRPFADYMAWLERRPLDDAYAYWRQRLDGLPAEPATLADRPRSTDSPHRQLTHDIDLDVPGAARDLRVTAATLLSAAWALALGSTLDTGDVLFGTLVSGRPEDLPGVEGMIGLFLNTLPTRVRLNSRADVRDWLRQLQADALADRRHGYVALPEIARRCHVPPGRSPVESLVVFQNAPSILPPGAEEFAEYLRVRPVVRWESDGMPLVLAALPSDGLRLVLGYDAAAVEVEVATALLQRTATALHHLVPRTAGRLADVDPIANRPAAPAPVPPAPVDLPGILAGPPDEQAAVVDADGTHSYAALRARATGVAERLRHHGIGVEQPVVVATRPGLDLVSGLYGVWLAGAMAVPAGPEEVGWIVADCAAAALVTDAPPPAPPDLPVILTSPASPAPSADIAPYVGTAPPAGAASHTSIPPQPVPSAAAVALYPPAPPAVVLSYEALASATAAWADAYDLRTHERHLIGAESTVDSMLVALLGAVAAGATLVVAPPDTGDDPTTLCALAHRHRVGVLHVLAPAAQALADSLPAREHGLPTVGTLVIGGDRLPVDTYERLRALLPDGATIRHVYGATEAGIDNVFSHAPHAATDAESDRLGPPLPGSRVAVLDRLGRPVASPGSGTLVFGGAAVARGYLGRPGETAARFEPDPDGPPGSRRFATGERVRIRRGHIERSPVAGAYRSGRGFRYRLTDLEAALTRRPDVVAAAAMVIGGRLVAAVEPPAGAATTVDIDGARQALANVPAPLRPDRIVAVAALPRRRDGQLDRAGLAALADGGSPPESPDAGAGWVVARAFTDVLELDRVGPHDNFFALGGDSLLALVLVGKLRENGLAVELRDLLERPTVADLTAHCGHSVPTPAGPPAEPGEVPLAPAQVRFFAHAGQAPAAFDMVEGVEIDGELDPADVQDAIYAVAAAHPALRARFHHRAGRWVQHVVAASDATAVPRLAVHDLRGYGGEEADRLSAGVIGGLRSTTDLGAGAPWSVALLLRPDRCQLVVAVHHLVGDPYSWHVLLGDLCRAALLGPGTVSRDHAGSYALWSRHLRTVLRVSAGDDAGFWAGELPGTQAPAGAAAIFGARADVTVSVPPDVTTLLLRGGGAGVEARLAAALARAYAAGTGEGGLALLVQSSGRDLAPPGLDVSRTVGWFTCHVPVWIAVRDEPAADTVRRAEASLRRALRRKHSWDLLRHDPDAPVSLGDRPEPAVALDYVGQIDRGITPPEETGIRPLFPPGRPRPATAPSDPTMRRTAEIGVEVAVAAGQLRATFHYSRENHPEATIAALAHRFRDDLLTADQKE